jgi:hypothetical protein
MPWPAGTGHGFVDSILLLPLCTVKASRPAVTGDASTKDLLILPVVARMHTHYGAAGSAALRQPQ